MYLSTWIPVASVLCGIMEVKTCWRKYITKAGYENDNLVPLLGCFLCFVFMVQDVTSQLLVPATMPGSCCHVSPQGCILLPPKKQAKIDSFFLELPQFMVSYHSKWKITNKKQRMMKKFLDFDEALESLITYSLVENKSTMGRQFAHTHFKYHESQTIQYYLYHSHCNLIHYRIFAELEIIMSSQTTYI